MRNEQGNVILPECFAQVVVWPYTVIDAAEVKDFESWMKDEFNARAIYIETVETTEQAEDQMRVDMLFSVHSDDLARFTVPRLKYGMRWIEDVYNNGEGHLYPGRVQLYTTW